MLLLLSSAVIIGCYFRFDRDPIEPVVWYAIGLIGTLIIFHMQQPSIPAELERYSTGLCTLLPGCCLTVILFPRLIPDTPPTLSRVVGLLGLCLSLIFQLTLNG